MRELKISTAPSRKATTWENTYLTQQDLVARAYQPTIVDLTTTDYAQLPKAQQQDLKDQGAFVAGHLKGGIRRKNHVFSRDLITLDLDNLPSHVDLKNHLTQHLDCAWLIHTTFSHTTAYPRYRLWIWLTRPVTPDEYEATARWLAKEINPDLGWFDPTTFQPERCMFWPAALKDVPYDVAATPKDTPLLNPDDILAQYESWTDITTWPGITPQDAQRATAPAKVADPRERPGMIGAFNRAYTIPQAIETFLPDTYRKERTPGRYTYTQGTSTNGLIVYDNGLLCFSQHATDPAADGHTHSSFELVRIHKFGDLDTDTPTTTPGNRLPSYLAMLDFIGEDPKTKKENARHTAAQIGEMFPLATSEASKAREAETTPHADSLDWLEQLETTKNGAFKDSLTNFELIFTHDPRYKHISWNAHSQRLEAQDPQALPWKQAKTGWAENDDAQLQTEIASTYKGLYSPTKMRTALLSVAAARAFHPVRDYFNNLPPWDGIPRLDSLLIDYLGAEDTPLARAFTRKTLTAAVRRTFHPGCKFDTVLTIVGPQGIGKSTIFKVLADPWYTDDLSIADMRDKTAAEKIAGNLICEIAELAGMRKIEAEPLKAFISRAVDKYRPAYARTVEEFPRQGIIVGTTNAEEGFLRDITGGRRWWIIKAHGTKGPRPHKMRQSEIDQVWAEAVAAEKAGESIYLDNPDLVAEAAALQNAAMEQDDRAGLVQRYLDTPLPVVWDEMNLTQRRTYLQSGVIFDGLAPTTPETRPRETVSRIEIWSECFGKEPEMMRRVDSYDISAIMKQITGWEDSGEREYLPIYGRQRILKRT